MAGSASRKRHLSARIRMSPGDVNHSGYSLSQLRTSRFYRCSEDVPSPATGEGLDEGLR